MGSNSSKYDAKAELKKMTRKQLEKRIVEAMAFQRKFPQFAEGRYNEYVNLLWLERAERIGRN